MLTSENLSKKTYYDILGVGQKASYEEIRASYRSSILNTHPDKLQKTPESSLTIQELEKRFVEVQKAWEILGNPKSRFTYDCELVADENDFDAAEDICLKDLLVEKTDEGLDLFHQCRCGDYYSISSCELEEMGYKLSRDENKVSVYASNDTSSSVLIPCGSCSLHVNLLISS